jgi:hypothetical protein
MRLNIKFTINGRCQWLTWNYSKVFFNSHLLVKTCLHDDVDAKEALNHVLWKNTLNLMTYAQILKDFGDFVESRKFFLHPQVDDLKLLPHEWWDFIKSWCMHICTHCSLYFGASVLCIIMWVELEFIFICQQQSEKSIHVGTCWRLGVC